MIKKNMNFLKTYWLNFLVFGLMFLLLLWVWRINERRLEQADKELKITNIETVGDNIKITGTALPNTKLKVIIK